VCFHSGPEPHLTASQQQVLQIALALQTNVHEYECNSTFLRDITDKALSHHNSNINNEEDRSMEATLTVAEMALGLATVNFAQASAAGLSLQVLQGATGVPVADVANFVQIFT
jgi:hypothetical protein